MKKLLIGLMLTVSSLSIAQMTTYTNNLGCKVVEDVRANGTTLTVTQGDQHEIVGYGKDYSFGDFTYCSDEKADIDTFEGSQGTAILISCSEHQNGHEITRGRVDISKMQGQLTEVKVDGQVDGFFGWKQELNINCTNLVLQ